MKQFIHIPSRGVQANSSVHPSLRACSRTGKASQNPRRKEPLHAVYKLFYVSCRATLRPLSLPRFLLRSDSDSGNPDTVMTGAANRPQASSPMEAFYMQSTKSFIQPGQFKIGYRSTPSNDVYSQVVSQDISDYLQDSFCVKEDETLPRPKRKKKSRRRLLTDAVPYNLSCGPRSFQESREGNCLHQQEYEKGMAEGSVLVIADTKIIVSSPAIVSGLRLQRGLVVRVQSLSVGDFQLSHRVGVLCVSSHLANGVDFVQRVRHLFELYDRPCIILEYDPQLSMKKRNRFYLMLLQLVSTQGKVLLSTSQDNTVDILAALARQEKRKGMAISALQQHGDIEEAVPFYMAMPKVNFAVAISLALEYQSITHFLHSNAEEIQRMGKVSSSRSQEIESFGCKASRF